MLYSWRRILDDNQPIREDYLVSCHITGWCSCYVATGSTILFTFLLIIYNCSCFTMWTNFHVFDDANVQFIIRGVDCLSIVLYVFHSPTPYYMGFTSRNYPLTPVLYNILLSYFNVPFGTIGDSASATFNILTDINSKISSVKPYFFRILYSLILLLGLFNL